MKVGFDGGIKLKFHGAKVTSDGGLRAYRDIDYTLGLFESVSHNFHDNRTRRNIQNAMQTLIRQSFIVILQVKKMSMTLSDYPWILLCKQLPV